MEYKITKTGNSPETTFNGITKDLLKVKIPAKVKLQGITFKVTSIADNACKGNKQITEVIIGNNITKIGKMAFYNCKYLSNINIKGTKLKSVGKNSIAGIKKDAVIQCKKNKKPAYIKLFTAKTGYKNSMEIK